ncbi:hypothetical protein [Mycobacterium szulgai]|uniref:hypothetical protein n=1 Tax=Mycobacterium szulgai TaxID=1787 RepID=UPI00111C3958|nr:hypothetical protein [Mycobacterium szulgai]MCV7079126.1 hypothetical protein [Mycobacterium szulgai]
MENVSEFSDCGREFFWGGWCVSEYGPKVFASCEQRLAPVKRERQLRCRVIANIPSGTRLDCLMHFAIRSAHFAFGFRNLLA